MGDSRERLHEALERLLREASDPSTLTLTAVREAAHVSNAQLHRLTDFKAEFHKKVAEAVKALAEAPKPAGGREFTRRKMRRTIELMANLIQTQHLAILELTRKNARLVEEASRGTVVPIRSGTAGPETAAGRRNRRP